MQGTFQLVDDYLAEMLIEPDEDLTFALEASMAAGLPEFQVAPNQGKLLWLLVKATRAHKVLEVGTLGGYSTIWLAKALPKTGLLVTLESVPLHAEVAKANILHAGLAGRVDVRLGAASESLARLHEEQAGPFDVVFIDADKPSNPDYFEWALRLTAPGSLIVIDNVVRSGKVLDDTGQDLSTRGVRQMFHHIATEPNVSGTAIQTVGCKGHDGFAIVLVS